MLFPFLQYISPTWYFNLPAAGDHPYFPDYDKLPAEHKALLDMDEGYSSRDVSKLDAAFQAWHKGFILEDPEFALDVQHVKPSTGDNYRFIRRYFHPLWSWYVLCLRLITFQNPVREIAGFLRHARVKRVNLYDQVYPHALGEREMFKVQSSMSNVQVAARLSTSQPLNPSTSQPLNPSTSQPLNFSTSQPLNFSTSQPPKVSIIIPTLNRYPYLKDALHDLEQQDYKNFDVIIVDQSEPFQPDFYESFQLDVKVIRQEEKALWLARNTAVKTSDAEYLLLYDDDSRVEADWISQHLKCLDYFHADISSGVSISVAGAKVPANYSFFRWSDQLDTGNVLIKREVFRRIGLFDRQFEGQRMGDGEFGLRAYLAGFKNVSNPLAGRLHLKVGEGGLRQMGSWDAFRPKSWLAPRPVPSVLYLVRKYFGLQTAVHYLLTGVPPSLMPYRFKRSPLLLLTGSLLILPLFPVIAWQVINSWRKAGHMLKEGAKVSSVLTSLNGVLPVISKTRTSEVQ